MYKELICLSLLAVSLVSCQNDDNIMSGQSGCPQLIWVNTYNWGINDRGVRVLESPDNEIAILGVSMVMETADVYLMKTDSEGDSIWGILFDGFLNATDFQETPDGGYIIAGAIYGAGLNGILLLKVDASGNEQWRKSYGDLNSDSGEDIELTSDGGYAVIAQQHFTAEGREAEYATLLIKTDSNGDSTWCKSYENIMGKSIRQTADYGFVCTGSISSEASDWDLILFKTDINGDILWNRTYDFGLYDDGKCVIPTADGGFVIGGHVGDGLMEYDILVMKTDCLGDVQWQQTFKEGDVNSFGNMRETLDGGYVLTATAYEVDQSVDVVVLKISALGIEQWRFLYHNGYINEGNDCCQTDDRGYVVTGKTGDNVLLLKLGNE